MKRIFAFTIFLIALTACTTFQVQIFDTKGTEIPQANLPNPASVYCTQQGNNLEIRTTADGSQFGVCFFLDGSSCDEWAYFRGECGPGAQISLAPITPDEVSQASGDDSARENASGGYMPPSTSEEISDWWGLIRSTPPGAQFDDFFERQDLGGVIYFGIDSMDPEIKAQIEALRDSGKIVHIYGALFSNVSDYNGSQVQVARIDIDG